MATAARDGRTEAPPAGRPAGTRYPLLFAALAAEFDQREHKTRSQKGKTLTYITARSAMNRLDLVLGPENWTDDYEPFGAQGVKCRLTITLPDGTSLTKAGIGGISAMPDPSDSEKSGESDALKRAAVKFGVARYLYDDGTPDFAPPAAEHHAANHSNGTGHGRTGAYPPPKVVAEYRQWRDEFIRDVNAKWADRMTDARGEVHPKAKELLSTFQVTGHLLKWGISEGIVNAPEDARPGQRDGFAAVVWQANRGGLIAEAETYARRKWKEALAVIRAHDAATAGPEDESQETDDDDVPDPEFASDRELGSDG